MTTTAFQYVFNNAESISINKKSVVGQTITRNNTVRSVSRGGQIWRFDVKLPDGMSWSLARPYIEAIEYADRYTTGVVNLNNPGYNNWLTPYQGNAVSVSGFTAAINIGVNAITLTANPTTSSGYKFRAGDIIQIGSGHVYSVSEDVAYNSNTVYLNRPVIETSGSYNLTVGPTVNWNVICTSLPQWTIFSRNQVSWSGPFTFYEAMI